MTVNVNKSKAMKISYSVGVVKSRAYHVPPCEQRPPYTGEPNSTLTSNQLLHKTSSFILIRIRTITNNIYTSLLSV